MQHKLQTQQKEAEEEISKLKVERSQTKQHSKELLKKKIAAELPVDDAEETAQALNRWSGRQAQMLIELLQESQ